MSATRFPHRPSDGKPLPDVFREPIPEWVDEPTVPDYPMDELDAELAQHAGAAGQGFDEFTFWPRKAAR